MADYDLAGDLDAFMVTHRKEPLTPPKIRNEGTVGNYTVSGGAPGARADHLAVPIFRKQKASPTRGAELERFSKLM